ncbi:synaptobrevin-domain-containing protein [Dissophora ornata]|nr:synaptobrevin-domain-containing protein [Dissophora ornata]
MVTPRQCFPTQPSSFFSVARFRSSPATPYDPPQTGPSSKTVQLQQQVNDVVGIMQQNIDSVRDRGENLDSLQHKTTDLEQGAVQFRRGASDIRRQMWWKNMKWRLIIILAVVIILIIIIVSIVKAK